MVRYPYILAALSTWYNLFTVNILFIDDTIQGNYVGIGGVIFHDDYLKSLSSFFNQKKASHCIPPEEEIKWSSPKNSWIAKNLTGEDRILAYSDILSLVKSFRGSLIVAVVHSDASKQNLREAKWRCIEFVTERFQFYLQAREDGKGLIIADFPASGKEEKQLLEDYYEFLEEGTAYVKPSNIVMNLLTTESHLNPSLQLADLVVGITTGMCSPRRKRALPYWDVVKRNFHRNQNGEVMGCGLKVFPNEIVGEIHATLFPEEIEETVCFAKSYEEYIKRMRYLYGVLMSEGELDMHFPCP
jgi:hypothetical protein